MCVHLRMGMRMQQPAGKPRPGTHDKVDIRDDIKAHAQVDFLAAKALSAEEQETARKHGERMAALTRRVPFQNGEGEPAVLQLFFRNTYKTNGGHMFDITVRRMASIQLSLDPACPPHAACVQMVALQLHCGSVCATFASSLRPCGWSGLGVHSAICAAAMCALPALPTGMAGGFEAFLLPPPYHV